MPVAQRSAADDLLDQVDLSASPSPVPTPQAGTPQPTPTPTPTPVPKAVGAPRSAADSLLDQVDQSGPGPVSRFVAPIAHGYNPWNIVKGVAESVVHPIDTYQADLAQRQAIGKEVPAEYKSGGIAGNLRGIVKRGESMVPFVGPALHGIGEQMEQGNLAGGYGSALTLGSQMAAPEVIGATGIGAAGIGKGIQSAGQGIAGKLYRSALKPTGPRAELLAERGLAEGIPVGTAASKPKRAAILNEQGQLIGGPVRSAPQDPIIDHNPIVADLTALKGDVLPDFHGQVDSVIDNFLKQVNDPNGITPAEALDM